MYVTFDEDELQYKMWLSTEHSIAILDYNFSSVVLSHLLWFNFFC